MTDNKRVVIELLPITITITITNNDVRHVVLMLVIVLVIEIRIHSVSLKKNHTPWGDMLAMTMVILPFWVAGEDRVSSTVTVYHQQKIEL